MYVKCPWPYALGLMPSLHIFLPYHQREIVVVQCQVPLIITKTIDVARAGDELIGEVAELEAPLHQAVLVYFGFAIGIEFEQDAAVFTQDVVDVANEVDAVAVEPVVEGTAALIGAELLVCPAHDLFSTFYAGVFHTEVVWGGGGKLLRRNGGPSAVCIF